MEDSRLKTFCLVVEMASFSRAGEALFLTQSAVSHIIRNLEKELGIKLLRRNAKNVVPTSVGRAFYEHATRILAGYHLMTNDICELVRKPKGLLRIGATETAAMYLFPQLLYNFSKAHPDVLISLSVAGAARIAEDMRQGLADLCVVEGAVNCDNIVSSEIASDEIVLICSDNNALARKRQITSHDLMSQPFILPEPGEELRGMIEIFLGSLGIEMRKIRVVMTLGNPDLMVQMVQTGLGIAFVSKWSIFRPVKEGTIKVLEANDKKLIRKFHIMIPAREYTSLVAKTFADFARRYRFFVPF